MTDYYAPNQQVVRADESGPAEEGNGGTPIPEPHPEQQPAKTEPKSYDPGAHTISEVQEYVTAHPDERSAILEAESANKNRTTLIEWFASS